MVLSDAHKSHHENDEKTEELYLEAQHDEGEAQYSRKCKFILSDRSRKIGYSSSTLPTTMKVSATHFNL